MAQWWEAAPLAQPQQKWWEAAPVIAPVAQAPISEEAATPAAPVERSWMDTLKSMIETGAGMVDQTGRGIAEGAMNIAGLPADIVNIAPTALNLLPGEQGFTPVTDEPYFGSARLKRGLNTANEATADIFGLEPPRAAPEGRAERFVNRVGEEVGAAAVPTAGIMAKAGQVGVQSARNGGWFSRLFLEPAAVNPERFAAKELATATAAGQGAAVANEAFPDSAVADIIGALGGAGVYGAAGMVGGGAKNVFNALRQNPNYTDDIVQEAVADRLVNAAGIPAGPSGIDTTDIVAAISGGSGVAQTIPGFVESLADRTGNAGLAALEYGRQSGPGAGQFAQRRSQNAEAVEASMSALEPQSTPGAFRSALAEQRDIRLSEANRVAREAQDAANQTVAPLQPRTTPAVRGDIVRSALEEQRDAARLRTEQAYEAADVTGRTIDPAQLTDTLETVLGRMTEVEQSLVPDRVIDRVIALGRGDEPAPATLKEATDLRSELSRLQRAALADPRAERGGRSAARVLGQISNAVDDFISSNLDPAEAEALQAARGAKFEEAEAFTRAGDPVAAALARNEGGRPRMRDERVAGTFTSPQALDRLLTQADTPQVRAAIRDELVSRADTGSPESIQNFVAENAEQLNRFPGLRNELETAARARGAERVAVAAETGIVRELGQKGRSTVAKYLEYGDEQAERAISTVLSNKQPAQAADELLTFVNDTPQATEGARAALWRVLRRESQSVDNSQRSMKGGRAWRGDWLKGFLDEPATAAVVERFYRDQPEQLNRIRQIADVLSNVDLRQRGKAVGTTGTAQGVNPVLTPETLQSRGYAYMRGQISGTYLATSIMAVMARRAIRKAQTSAIDMLTDKALLDPEVAAQLLKKNNPANRTAMARKAKLWFGNEASTIVNMMNDEDDPLLEAIGD